MADSANVNLTPTDIALLIDMFKLGTFAVNTAADLIKNSPLALEAIAGLTEDVAEPIVDVIKDVICDV